MNKAKLEEHQKKFIIARRYEERAKSTTDKYDRITLLFLSTIPDNSPITKDTALNFKQYLVDLNHITSTINNYITIMNSLLIYAKLKTLVIKKIKVQQKSSLKNILEPIDYKRLLRWSKNKSFTESYMIMKVFAETGARVAELKFFTVESLADSNYINVSNKGKERNLIIRNDLRRELKKYCTKNKIESGYIFRGRKNTDKPACEVTIWREMKEVAGLAKVAKKKVHAHSFRHLFALRWIDLGYNITDLADVLGHNDIKTTAIYTKTTDEMKKKKIEQMRY